MEIQMDQLNAWFRMVAYLIDGQASVINYFQSCQWIWYPVFQHDYFPEVNYKLKENSKVFEHVP